jgi:hypothetical protein
MTEYFETDRILLPFDKIARVAKALDKNGKVYSVTLHMAAVESISLADHEADRFLAEYKAWFARRGTAAAPLAGTFE